MALKDIVREHNIKFKKTLGQNLLLDENINRIMVDAAALTADDDAVEVGAGLGALTERIRQRAGRVFSVEIDRAFMPILESQFGDAENVALFRGDILNHPLDKLLDEFIPGAKSLKMVSNLPYYITAPILFHFWESPLYFERFVVMVQKEVGERMAAPVGSRDYGKFTLAVNYQAEVDIVHQVPRTCFKPMPKVDSVIVRLRNRKEPRYAGVDGAFLMDLVGAAFSQRRKTLRNTLIRNTTLDIPQEKMADAFETVGIDPSLRPQTLTLDQFAAIAREVQPGG